MRARLGSISPTFYMQLLHTQIPKAQKRQSNQVAFALAGSVCIKAARKHVDEIDPWFACNLNSNEHEEEKKPQSRDPIIFLQCSLYLIEIVENKNLQTTRAYCFAILTV